MCEIRGGVTSTIFLFYCAYMHREIYFFISFLPPIYDWAANML